MTNADRIRSMTDEELADFLAQITDSCFRAGKWGDCNLECPMWECCNDQESDNIEDWLKQEVSRD